MEGNQRVRVYLTRKLSSVSQLEWLLDKGHEGVGPMGYLLFDLSRAIFPLFVFQSIADTFAEYLTNIILHITTSGCV